MARAVGFDLGGGVFAEGKSVAVEELAREHGHKKDTVLAVLSATKRMDLRKGLISDEEFWGWAQRQIPEGYDALLIKKEWYGGYVLDEYIFGLIKQLGGKYRIIAFSGNIRSRVEFLEKNTAFGACSTRKFIRSIITGPSRTNSSSRS